MRRAHTVISEGSSTLSGGQRQRIVIAHRLSTIVNADRIIVLIDGVVAQNGSYQKLLNEPGPFANLAKRQIA